MADKRTVLQFVGGDQDGRVADSAKETPEEASSPNSVAGILRMTNGGKLGSAFRSMSQRYIQALLERQPVEELGDAGAYSYQVTSRQETDDCVTLTLTMIPEPLAVGTHDIRGEISESGGQLLGSIPAKGKTGAIPFHITQVTRQSRGSPSWVEVTVGDGLQLRLNPEFCIEPHMFSFIHYGWKNAKPLLHGAEGDFEVGGIKCCAWSEGKTVFIDMAQRRAAFHSIGEN